MPERKYDIPKGDEIDYLADVAKWLENGPTATQELFGDWIVEKADLATHFKTAKEVEAARLGVQLALKYRMHFQRSPENHAGKDEARAAREEEAENRKAAAAERRAAKAAAKEDAPAARPTRRGAKAAATEAPAKPAARRGRAAAAAPAEKPARATRRPAATAGAKARAPRRGAAAAEADF